VRGIALVSSIPPLPLYERNGPFKNIRTFFDSVKNKVTVIQGLEKTFYGATEFSIKDNNGFLLTFAEDEQ
jgi:uncharacterized glyoxalase superfamily protein PhnB